MKRVFAALIIFLTASVAFSQKTVRVAVPDSGAEIAVKGTVRGRGFVVYEVRVTAGTEWFVDLLSANQYIGFTVKGPNGDRYDFLETTRLSGIYKIRVELNSTGARKKGTAAYVIKIRKAPKS